MTRDDERGPREDDDHTEDVHGDTPEAERETVRGEQGTSSGDPHDDRDPQAG
jgi:hypothetical protein